jgi:hypothetical protein
MKRSKALHLHRMRKSTNSRIKPIALLTMAAMLSGCAGTHPLQTVDANHQVMINPAFGTKWARSLPSAASGGKKKKGSTHSTGGFGRRGRAGSSGG